MTYVYIMYMERPKKFYSIAYFSSIFMSWEKCGRLRFFLMLCQKYRKVASRSTCHYSGNQVFGGATNRDMSLNETCFYSWIQKIWIYKSRLVTCPTLYYGMMFLSYNTFFCFKMPFYYFRTSFPVSEWPICNYH